LAKEIGWNTQRFQFRDFALNPPEDGGSSAKLAKQIHSKASASSRCETCIVIPRFVAGTAYPPKRIEERLIEGSKFQRHKTSVDADVGRSTFVKEQIGRIVFFRSRAKSFHRDGKGFSHCGNS
jgi:hypothetical protein